MKALLAIAFACVTAVASAENVAELIARGDALDAQLKSEEALKIYLQAEPLAKDDATLLIKIAKQYGESMTGIKDTDGKRKAGENALAYAQRAVTLAPKMCDAHLAVAICYGRLLDLVPARTRVEYSRFVKQEAETAVKLDPKSDYAWHMLGRWHQALAEIGGVTRALAKVFYGGLPPASHQEALKCFEKAHALNANRLIHAIELGRTHAALGNTKEARRYIEQGLAMKNTEKDDPETKERGRATLENLSS
jgi:tetratricopeptide (TPR) repeat protein